MSTETPALPRVLRPFVDRLIEQVKELVDANPEVRILCVLPATRDQVVDLPEQAVTGDSVLTFRALVEALGERVEHAEPYRAIRVKGARRWRYDSIVLSLVAGRLDGLRFDVALTEPGSRMTHREWWDHVAAHANVGVFDV